MLRRLAADDRGAAARFAPTLIHKTERQVVQLALAIARRIVQREITLDRELLTAMARVALDRLGASAHRDHPPASRRLRGHASASRTARCGRRRAGRSPIPVVRRGGCLVQSDFGLIDVGVDAQFQELTTTLARPRRRAPMRSAPRRRSCCRLTLPPTSSSLDPLLRPGARVRAGAPHGPRRPRRRTARRIERSARAHRRGLRSSAPATASPLPVEVVGFRDGRLLSVPLGDTTGIRPGDRLVARGGVVSMPVGAALLGRVIDGLGRPLDGLGPLRAERACRSRRRRVNPLSRESDRGADRHRRARHRRAADLRPRPAHRPVRRQRRRQEHAARHDGARHRRRRRRAGAGRRTRPRSAQLSRARPRPRTA